MTYQAPDLTTEITRGGASYLTELDGNFDAIQTALQQIQNELAVAQPGGDNSASNIGWLQNALEPDGIVGTDSFEVSFSSDEDTITISHPESTGESMCVMGRFLFRYSDSFSQDLSTVVTTDGTFRVAIGARKLGAPRMELAVVQSDGDTGDVEADLDLVFYDLDVTLSSGVYTVSNLRLRATVLLSRESFANVHDRVEALNWEYAGSLPLATGVFGRKIIVPFDCEVIRAYLSPMEGPSANPTEIELLAENDTDADVLAGTAEWSLGDSTTKTIEGNIEPTQLAAGSVIFVRQVQADAGGDFLDLSMVLLVRRIYHAIA